MKIKSNQKNIRLNQICVLSVAVAYTIAYVILGNYVYAITIAVLMSSLVLFTEYTKVKKSEDVAIALIAHTQFLIVLILSILREALIVNIPLLIAVIGVNSIYFNIKIIKTQWIITNVVLINAFFYYDIFYASLNLPEIIKVLTGFNFAVLFFYMITDWGFKFEQDATAKEKKLKENLEEVDKRSKILAAINSISQKLMTIQNSSDFSIGINSCLKEIGQPFNVSTIILWRSKIINDQEMSYPLHVWDEFFNEEKTEIENEQYIALKNIIESEDYLPLSFQNLFNSTKITNSTIKNLKLSDAKKTAAAIGLKTLFAVPIYIDDEFWGIIAAGGRKNEDLLLEMEVNMLGICGQLFAHAITKEAVDGELKAAHKKAVFTSQLKTTFLTNVSHEIRTPMNAILGMSEIILRDSKDNTITGYASEISNASKILLSLINEILDISKIESGKIEIIENDYEISSVLNDVISIVKMRLGKKDLLFTANIDSKLPHIMKGDATRLSQIMINLLGNAIKFTTAGSISLSISGTFKDNIAELIIEVSDTGMGISKEDFKLLFEQFERVGVAKNSSIEGTGLGLSIVQRLSEAMNGTISVTSELGKGTTFKVVVPQTYEDYKQVATVTESPSVLLIEPNNVYAQATKKTIENLGCECFLCTKEEEYGEYLAKKTLDYILVTSQHLTIIQSYKNKHDLAAKIIVLKSMNDTSSFAEFISVSYPITCIQIANIFSGREWIDNHRAKIKQFTAPKAKILVVDDNAVNLKVATGLLAPYKMRVDTVLSGMEALEKVKEHRYDMIFMDHMMPGMDGIQTTKAIRDIDGEHYKTLPIVALTANALVGVKDLFLREGLNDFLAKPIETYKMNDILRRWIPTEKQEMKVEGKIEENSAKDSLQNIKIDGIDIIQGIKGVGGNIENYHDILHTYYTSGLQNCETIRQSYAGSDFYLFRVEIHSLKSSSASIGAMSISKKASKLESMAIEENLEYITTHTPKFLEEFTLLLENINKYFNSIDAKEEHSEASMGDVLFLSQKLQELNIALSEFNTDAIDAILSECLNFNWESNIKDQLMKIKEHTAKYDYYTAKSLAEEIINWIT